VANGDPKALGRISNTGRADSCGDTIPTEAMGIPDVAGIWGALTGNRYAGGLVLTRRSGNLELAGRFLLPAMAATD
jgi:hypothetical protein